MKHLNLRLAPSSGIIALSLTLMLFSPPALAATKFEQFNNAAEVAYKQKDYPAAQQNFELAIKEAEKMDKSDKRIATTVYNLSLVFQAEGNYGEAEKNMLKAADMMVFLYGPEHQRIGQVYQDIADLYLEQSGQEEKPELKKKAAEFYKKSAEVFEKIYSQAAGSENADKEQEKPKDAAPKDGTKKSDAEESNKTPAQSAALFLSNSLRLQADLYAEDELYPQSDPLYTRSLELEEFASGPDDPDLAAHKAKMAEYWCVQQKYKKAEPLFKDAIASIEKTAPDSNNFANILYNCGGMYYDQGAFGEAEVYFKRGLKLWEKSTEMKPDDIAQK
ncbi:MAG: tetratricopeptide repeat protein, partial [Candidatus Obscuribacterales bacterium]|nr:tetratricopeptide repeat protein [Candidatus Obscuribacterales bacterium]